MSPPPSLDENQERGAGHSTGHTCAAGSRSPSHHLQLLLLPHGDGHGQGEAKAKRGSPGKRQEAAGHVQCQQGASTQGQAVLSVQAEYAEHRGTGAQLLHEVGGAQVIGDSGVEPHGVVELHGYAERPQQQGRECQAEHCVAQAPRDPACAFSTTGADSASPAAQGEMSQE